MDEIRDEMIDEMEEETAEEMPEETPTLPEALFQVETVLNVQTQLEASNAVRGKLMDLVSWGCMGICVVLLGLLTWQYFTAEIRDNSLLLLIAVLLFSLGMFLYNKFIGQKKSMKRWEDSLVRQYGSPELHLSTEFFERSLCQTLRENDDTQVEGYSKISRMRESESLFLLNCGKQQWFFVSKTGFVKGTPDEFRTFISEKIGGK